MKDKITFLKDNISLIALLPLILGGIWQVLSLVTLSPSYLRFFSVTQQIADGLVILFVISVIYSTVYMATKAIFTGGTPLAEWVKTDTWTLIWKASLCMFFILGVGGVMYFEMIVNQSFYKNLDLLSLSALIFFTLILIGLIRWFLIHLAALYIKFNLKMPNWENLKTPIVYTLATSTLFLTLLLLVGITFSIIVFHRKYYLPENLKNVNYMLDKYCSKTNDVNRDSISIAYMNDKYIFIKERSNIEVVKFDYLFREDK